MAQSNQHEIDKNFEFFCQYAPQVIEEHSGQYALLRQQRCEGFFQTLLEAVTEATNRFKDGRYSIQEVTEAPIDLGFFSHANNQGDMR